jgi:hypothetical protein
VLVGAGAMALAPPLGSGSQCSHVAISFRAACTTRLSPSLPGSLSSTWGTVVPTKQRQSIHHHVVGAAQPAMTRDTLTLRAHTDLGSPP